MHILHIHGVHSVKAAHKPTGLVERVRFLLDTLHGHNPLGIVAIF